MRKSYQELMNHICLTGEMEARILENLKAVHPKKQLIPGALAAAACLLLLLSLPMLKPSAPLPEPQKERPMVQSAPRAEPAQSAEALSRLLGFPLRDLPQLPFAPSEIRYASYFGSVAEITCEAEGETAVFRMARGTGEVSGDFTPYASQKQIEVLNLSVTLRGDGEDAFSLALFQDEAYSYSVKLSTPADSQQWSLILEDYMTP